MKKGPNQSAWTECRAATRQEKAVATEPGIGHLDAFSTA